jgi:hypothetical protein
MDPALTGPSGQLAATVPLTQRVFYLFWSFFCIVFNALGIYKLNINVLQHWHGHFYISNVPVWFRSHPIFECYTLSGYIDCTMSYLTALTPSYRQPSTGAV